MENLSGQTFPFSILKEDYENSNKDYYEPSNCPATVAIKRQFNLDATACFDEIVTYPGVATKLATIGDMWWNSEFDRLEKGIEFHTTITFL